jgi:DNA mismatch repair protein MutS
MEKLTPMMKQYFDVKNNYPDALLFYRLGDFYELFYEDAKLVSLECDLVLTSRGAGNDQKAPMCGVPHHAVTPYIQKLIGRGYKVAIVEQMEDPALAKGIVKRDVIRIITPGTIMDENADEKNEVYIAAVEDDITGYAIAACEMASGKTVLRRIEHSRFELIQYCLRNNVREIVFHTQVGERVLKRIREVPNLMISFCDEHKIDDFYLPLVEHVQRDSLHTAYGRLINYLQSTQFRTLTHLQRAEIDDVQTYCELDYSTMTNLELLSPLRPNGKNLTLFSYMDRCKSAMGSRLLKSWIEKPLTLITDIQNRQTQVAVLVKDFLLRDRLMQHCKGIYDLQRICAKIAFKSAIPQDMVRLMRSLRQISPMKEMLSAHESFHWAEKVDPLTDLLAILENRLEEDVPATAKEGGIFVNGYSELLDHYRDVTTGGNRWLLEFENREKDRTGIKNLKVGYNRVFGYYIEVSKGSMGLVKDEFGYIRKQTLTNAERYICEELKGKEDELLHAKERAVRLEEELFNELISEVSSFLPKIQIVASFGATIDALSALAQISSQSGFVLPVFTDKRSIHIEESKHPLLASSQLKHEVISNSLEMKEEDIVFVLTGPNMGGKSTYMRQIALTAIMAQMGCYVLARKASMPIFDRIFTRMGASDDILGGQSTFMVEMNEANTALQKATNSSLILFDEIGRGTSTYDGMALAQAIIEYIATITKAKTIFSTHYHELTALADSLTGVVNVFVQVYEKEEDITFLYRVKHGKADKSYGINVARLAHLPDAVIHRAKDLLRQLESRRRVVQQSMDVVEIVHVPKHLEEIQKILDTISIETITPLQALTLLDELKEKSKGVK